MIPCRSFVTIVSLLISQLYLCRISNTIIIIHSAKKHNALPPFYVLLTVPNRCLKKSEG